MEIANLVAVYDADTKGFDKGTDHVESRIEGAGRSAERASGSVRGFGSSIGDLGSRMQNTGSMATSFGQSLTVGFTAPIAALTTLGLKFNSTKEQALVAFGVLLKDGEKAKALYADLLKFAAQTPFEAPEVVQSAKILKAYGFELNELMPLMQDVGNLASGMGVKFDEVAMVFGRIKAGDFGQAFARLRDFGIATTALKGEGLKFDSQGAYKGSVEDALAAVRKIIQRDFNGMMEEQSKTFAGRMSTLWDTINQSLGAATEPLFKKLSAGLGDLLPWVDRLAQGFIGLGPTIQSVIFIVAGIAAAAGPVVIAFGAIVSAIGSIVAAAPTIGILAAAVVGLGIQFAPLIAYGAALYAAWQTDFGGIRELVATVADGLKLAWQTAMDAISQLTDKVTSELSTFWTENGADIMRAVTTVSNNVTAAWQKVVAWFKSNMPALQQIATGVWQVISAAVVGAVRIITNTIKLIAAVINGDWSKAWDATKTILLTVVGAWTNILMGAGKMIVGAVRVAFSAVFALQTWLYDQALALGRAIVSGAIAGLKTSASALLGAASSVFSPVINTVRGIFQTQSPSRVFMGIGKDVVQGFLDGLASLRAAVGPALASTFDISGLKLGKGDSAGVEVLSGLMSEVARLNAGWRVQQVELDLTAGKYGKLNDGVKTAILSLAAVIDKQKAFSDGMGFFDQQFRSLTDGLGPKKTAVEELNDALAGPGVQEAFDRMTVKIGQRTVAYGKLLEKILQTTAAGKDALSMNFGAGPADLGLPNREGTGSGSGVDFEVPQLNIPPPPIAPWETFWGGIRAEVGRTEEATTSWTTALQGSLTSALLGIGDVFANAVRQWDGTIGGFFKNVGKGFARLAQQILAELTRIAIMQAVLKIIGAAAGGLGGGGLGGAADGVASGAGAGIAAGGGGFASGGYTGHGTKYQPAGIVHRGEFVFSQESVKSLGVGFLSGLHNRSRGFAAGGYAQEGFTPTYAMSAGAARAAEKDSETKPFIFSPHYHANANGQFSKKSAEQSAADLMQAMNRTAVRR